jgi:hypothetical protein
MEKLLICQLKRTEKSWFFNYTNVLQMYQFQKNGNKYVFFIKLILNTFVSLSY